MKRLIPITALIGLALTGCGSAETVYMRDGVCYSHTRTWLLGVTVDSSRWQTDKENCK